MVLFVELLLLELLDYLRFYLPDELELLLEFKLFGFELLLAVLFFFIGDGFGLELSFPFVLFEG